MRNHFRRRQRAQPAAIGQALAMGQAIEESGGELVARAGGVDHLAHRRGRHFMHHAFLDDDAALGRAGEGGDAAPFLGRRRPRSSKSSASNSALASSSLANRMFDILVQQMQELVAEAADAETVGQRQRDASARALHRGDGLARGVLGAFLVPQIAFDIENAGARPLRSSSTSSGVSSRQAPR